MEHRLIFWTSFLLFCAKSYTIPVTKSDFKIIAFPQNTNGSFYLSNYRATRAQAVYDCYHQFWGNLLSITSPEEDQMFADFVMEESGIMILTAGYKERNGSWHWATDLNPFTFTNWAPNHPTSYNECLCIGGTSSNYGWYSTPCGNPTKFVCVV